MILKGKNILSFRLFYNIKYGNKMYNNVIVFSLNLNILYYIILTQTQLARIIIPYPINYIIGSDKYKINIVSCYI